MMSHSLTLPASLHQIVLPEKLPPLVVIAFTRPELLQKVLMGIRQQTLMPQQIIAFIDGARNKEDQPLIEQCIALLQDLAMVIPVEIVLRSQNLGCDQNVLQALTEVLSVHDALIYLEDDTVPNPYFFDRMCRLLEAYRHTQQIFSVSAYASLVKELQPSSDVDFEVSHRVFPWGFGIWADRWQDINLVNQPKQYNPFSHFYQIPVTPETKLTLLNQFWMEKNQQTDWVITMTLAALSQNRRHIIPRASLTYNIGFGHAQSKTYRGKEPAWVNSKYSPSACPDLLPQSIELRDSLKRELTGEELVQYLSQKDIWLNPAALFHLMHKCPDPHSKAALLRLFAMRMPTLLRRVRSGLPT